MIVLVPILNMLLLYCYIFLLLLCCLGCGGNQIDYAAQGCFHLVLKVDDIMAAGPVMLHAAAA